jgi:hypothetical protein
MFLEWNELPELLSTFFLEPSSTHRPALNDSGLVCLANLTNADRFLTIATFVKAEEECF